jgi:glycyl-tRNA synthetase beta subunit
VQGLVDNAVAAFSLRQALTAVRSGLPAPMSDDAFESALSFIIGRQRAALLEAGHRHDVIEAVISIKGEVPYEAQRFVEQLGRAVNRDDWPTLLAAYSRCARILKSTGVPMEDIIAVDINDAEPSAQRLSEKLSSLTKPGDISELVALLEGIEPLITDFFNKVLVNAEDPGLRRMRLSLVNRVVELANGIVDFSKVEGF